MSWLPILSGQLGERAGQTLDQIAARLRGADASQTAAAELPGGKIGTVTLPARVEYATLIDTFKTLATAKEVPYRLHGSLVFPIAGRKFDLPFELEDSMPGPAEAIRKGARGILDSQ